MPRGYVLNEKEIVGSGRGKKVRLTEKEVAPFRKSQDLEKLVAVMNKKLGVNLKPPFVGVIGVGGRAKQKSGSPKPRESSDWFKQGDTWLSIQDDDGSWYTYDWGNSECCQGDSAGPCE
jgi:hypothetical protein